MQQLKIRLCIIGQPPPDLDINRITKWKSAIWRIEGMVESFALSQNADLDSWGYSDKLLSSLVPANANGHDFTFCILNIPLEGNFYSRRLAGNVVCFSFYETAEILRHYNISISNAPLRLVYGFSLIFKRCKGVIPPTTTLVRFTHDEARGCIFDMNGIKTEIALSCNDPILCESCKAASLDDGASREFLTKFEKEIKMIRKDAYFRISDAVKRYPLIAIFISIFAAFLVNLASSFAYDFIKKGSNKTPETTSEIAAPDTNVTAAPITPPANH